MTEAQLQQRITDLCDWLGLTWHHETDSRRSKAGFPDLVIVGNAVVFAELKTDRGRVSTEQTVWLDVLTKSGAEAYLWRPTDWPEIEARLRELAKPSPPDPWQQCCNTPEQAAARLCGCKGEPYV